MPPEILSGKVSSVDHPQYVSPTAPARRMERCSRFEAALPLKIRVEIQKGGLRRYLPSLFQVP